MKHLLSTLTILLISYIFSFAQTKNLTNPIYLGMILVDQPNEEKMEGICEYYDLVEEPEQDGYRVFRHSNGTEFRFKTDENNSKFTPIVKVITHESNKFIEGMLNDAGYKQEPGGYVKGTKFEHRCTRCKVSGHTTKTLTFSKEYNSLE